MNIPIRKEHASIIFFIILGVFLVSNSATADKEIPLTKFSKNVGPTMTFLYCYSCGYRKAFEEYQAVIHDKYPEIVINGGNYDPPGMNVYLSKIILITKIVLIIGIMSSFDVAGILGQPAPGWWKWCTDNKLYACMMIFFLGNMLEAQLISSGAFEISLNDVPVWSKLTSGRIPVPQELFQIIDSHLFLTDNHINGNEQHNPDFVKWDKNI